MPVSLDSLWAQEIAVAWANGHIAIFDAVARHCDKDFDVPNDESPSDLTYGKQGGVDYLFVASNFVAGEARGGKISQYTLDGRLSNYWTFPSHRVAALDYVPDDEGHAGTVYFATSEESALFSLRTDAADHAYKLAAHIPGIGQVGSIGYYARHRIVYVGDKLGAGIYGYDTVNKRILGPLTTGRDYSGVTPSMRIYSAGRTLYALDGPGHRVVEFKLTHDGRHLERKGEHVTDSLASPSAITMFEAGFAVGDSNAHAILIFDVNWEKSGQVSTETELNSK